MRGGAAVHADVIESTPSGFTIRTSVEPVVRIVDQVLAGQVQRLKRYLETGPLR